MTPHGNESDGAVQKPGASLEMNPIIEQRLKALEFFKDWSNYLLITTVAALGWVATKDSPGLPPLASSLTILCFGFSIVFGIFTLALIPLVAEKISGSEASFYEIRPEFNLFWICPTPITCVSLKTVCWPQHVLFIVGIGIFTLVNAYAQFCLFFKNILCW
jgi:hypothetical protein